MTNGALALVHLTAGPVGPHTHLVPGSPGTECIMNRHTQQVAEPHGGSEIQQLQFEPPRERTRGTCLVVLDITKREWHFWPGDTGQVRWPLGWNLKRGGL